VADIRRDLEDLYRARYERFCRVAAAVTGDRERARDAVQAGFALALRNAGARRRDGSLQAWVARIVFHEALDQRRRAGLVAPFEPMEVEGPGDASPIDAPLVAALRALSPQRRLVVFLHYYADFSYAEIAEAVGISEGTVGATLTKARELLRESLRTEVRG
jgi:RNA polymerase sigma factor (sigma-70 family)